MSEPTGSAPADETLREFYHLHFAGRPRLTRNTALLRQLIALAENNHNGALVALWTKELQHIDDERHKAGAVGLEVARRMEDAQIIANRLRFLQLDASRYSAQAIDRTAVIALQEDARALAAAVAPLVESDSGHAGRARGIVQALDAVADACQAAASAAHLGRTQGPVSQRAQACVHAAQLLQHTFATRVAGRPGTVVRSERIALLADGLESVAHSLEACAIAGPEHAANCANLAGQVADWRAQAERATALRRQQTQDELAHSLAAAADEVLEGCHRMGEGQDGDAVLAQGLALCDRMDEIRRQLESVPLIFGLAEHQHTLSTVTDGLAYLTARLEHFVPEAARENHGSVWV